MSDLQSRPRILVVCGTRPEAIKLAPVVAALTHIGAQPLVCAVRQHTEMLDSVFDIFDLSADVSINLDTTDRLAGVFAQALCALTDVLSAQCPDAVVVQGDTTTAYAAALAAFYCGIRVAHVEAGLRSHTPMDPWPEEAHRRNIAALSRWHYCPTDTAAANLQREGISEAAIVVSWPASSTCASCAASDSNLFGAVTNGSPVIELISSATLTA